MLFMGVSSHRVLETSLVVLEGELKETGTWGRKWRVGSGPREAQIKQTQIPGS